MKRFASSGLHLQLRETLIKEYKRGITDSAMVTTMAAVHGLGHAARLQSARATYKSFEDKPLDLKAVHAAQTLAIVEGEIAASRLSIRPWSIYTLTLDTETDHEPDDPVNLEFTGQYYQEYARHGDHGDQPRHERIADAMGWLLEDVEYLSSRVEEQRERNLVSHREGAAFDVEHAAQAAALAIADVVRAAAAQQFPPQG